MRSVASNIVPVRYMAFEDGAREQPWSHGILQLMPPCVWCVLPTGRVCLGTTRRCLAPICKECGEKCFDYTCPECAWTIGFRLPA